MVPAMVGGVVGAGLGLRSPLRARLGARQVCTTYGSNLFILVAAFCGAREFVRHVRNSTTDDLMNSVIGGLACGTALRRLRGKRIGPITYTLTITTVGTTVDFAVMQLNPLCHALKEHFSGDKGQFTFPEWSPIQVLDEEAMAKKRAREEKLFSQRAFGEPTKEDP